MATSTGQKWLIGCGVGCLLVILLVIAVITAGVIFFRDTARGFESAVETRAELERIYGTPDEFTPWPGGEIPADRVEAFLAIRQETAEVRRKLSEQFAAIPMSEAEARELDEKPSGEKVVSVFKILGSALGLGAEMGDFLAARNAALQEHAMGMGEYTYVYALAYYGGSRHDPEDGPHTGRGDPDRVDVQFEGHSDSRVRHDLLSMLRHQLQQDAAVADEAWVASLTAEIEAMERDPERYPWQGELPASTARSLEPFRERLEASYDPVSNLFELVVAQKKGLSITAD
jgi:hypothetical protein